MSEHDVPAERGRDELRDAIASALYNEFRVGKMPDYRPMWHEVEEATRAKYRAMTNALLEPFAALLAPQEAPICLQCIERAEQEIAAGHYYRANELIAALRERREPVCACGETHPDRTPLAAARPAPEAREPEVLGYVVERQHTPGEWVRVWRGSTLWFDHDEAVLERDAYALDGIPARIRGVYLGAPAPAEATEASDALRSAIEAMGDLHRALLHMGRGRLRAAEATERSES